MRTIYNRLLVVVFIITWSWVIPVGAQTYGQTLDPIWVNGSTTNKTLEIVAVANDQILNESTFKLNKAIRKARRWSANNQTRDHKALELTTYTYLRTLKYAANHAQDESEFKDLVIDKLPVLEPVFKEGEVDDLYQVIRKDTFNGRLEALPSVL